MNKSITIAMRDFKSYFFSPVAYVIFSGFLFLSGWTFFHSLQNFIQRNMYSQGANTGQPLNLTQEVLVPLFGNMLVFLLFIVPAITMRLFAEEKKSQTLSLPLTSPITLMELVIGKYLSAMFFIFTLLGATFIYPIILIINGNPEIAHIASVYLGMTLLSSCYVAMGVAFSAITENQIIAFILTFSSLLFFWLIGWASQSSGPVMGEVLGHLSLINHFSDFAQGVINSKAIVYYLSFTGFCLMICYRIMDAYRWR